MQRTDESDHPRALKEVQIKIQHAVGCHIDRQIAWVFRDMIRCMYVCMYVCICMCILKFPD